MVCLGNICRSPLAEGILRSKLPPEQYHIDSAGTASFHIGSAPDPRSIEVAAKNNIDIAWQKASAFTKEDFQVFDKIFVMDQNNYDDVIGLSSSVAEKYKVQLMPANSEVPDPYYGDATNFKMVFNLLDEACNKICTQIENDKS